MPRELVVVISLCLEPEASELNPFFADGSFTFS